MKRHLRFFAVAILIPLRFALCAAQDAAAPQANPFGGAPVVAAPAATAKPQSGDAVAKPDPAVDTIVDSRPTTPAAVLRAAALLADLDRTDLAKKYLEQLAAASPNEDALADAAAQVNPAMLMRLAANPALQPEGRQLADAALAAAARRARDPQRMQAEINRLVDPARSVKREALTKILGAHDEAVPGLLTALADPSRPAVHPLVRQALVKIGEQAVPPLVAGLQTENAALKVEMIDVLSQLGSRDAVLHLVAPATAEGTPPEVRGAAREALAEIQGIKNPTRAEAVTLLTREIEHALKHDRLFKLDANGTVDVWIWEPAAKMPVKQSLPPDLAAIEMAVPLALDLLRLAPETDGRARQMAAAVVLESLANRTGIDYRQQRLQYEAVFNRPSDRAIMEDTLRWAVENRHIAAATVAAEILGNIGDRSLLNSQGPIVRPLVTAVEQGDRRLRFAAAEAMMKFKPTAPFAGSSDLMNALAFFADSPGVRRALVAFPNEAVAGQLAAMLAGMGYEADIATNGHQAYLQAISSGDYELVLLSSRLDRPPVWVAIQQLRHDPRTARLPIALLAEDAEGDIERMRSLAADDPLTAAFQRPVTPEGMKFFVDRLNARAGGEIVPTVLRKQQALAALGWLKELNATSKRDFDLLPYEAQLTRALHRPETSTAAADLLAAIGTHTAVKSLAGLANMSIQPMPMREAAAAAFSSAIRQHGIQLTTADIKQQYERYNQSVLEDQATQQMLGLMLDAIEMPSKRK